MNVKVISGKEAWNENVLAVDCAVVCVSGKGLSLKPQENSASATQSQVITKAIDSLSEGAIWYRLAVDADVPPCTKAEVSYAISDNPKQAVSQLTWLNTPVESPSDSLIIGPKGRYIWLKITLTTTGTAKNHHSSPTVKNIRLYSTEPTYINHLPAFYQENPESKAFLVNYLSMFEAVLTNIESRIQDAPRLFDAEQTPDEFLPWLSTWVGAVKDDNWPQDKWREFLKHAAKIYKIRGTKEELREIIRIYVGTHPYAIVERALLADCDVSDGLKALFDELFGGPYDFTVLLRASHIRSEADKKVIKRIIDTEKPAHTCGRLVVLEEQIRLDSHTYLGVNTRLNEPPSDMVLDRAILSFTTTLPPNEDESLK